MTWRAYYYKRKSDCSECYSALVQYLSIRTESHAVQTKEIALQGWFFRSL